MAVYKINDQMYEQNITFVFNKDFNQFRGYLKRNFGYNSQDELSDGKYFHLYSKGYPDKYIIWVSKFEGTIYDYGVLSHEVFHCVYDILNELGFRLSDDSVEAYCYYYQRILQECLFGALEYSKKKEKT
jgi:hypothetical protein